MMGMTLVRDLAMLMRSLPGRWANSTAYTHPRRMMMVMMMMMMMMMY